MKRALKKIGFAQLFISYKGQWVALTQDESYLAGAGATAKEAVGQARRAGIEIPILFKVPRRVMPFVGLLTDD